MTSHLNLYLKRELIFEEIIDRRCLKLLNHTFVGLIGVNITRCLDNSISTINYSKNSNKGSVCFSKNELNKKTVLRFECIDSNRNTSLVTIDGVTFQSDEFILNKDNTHNFKFENISIEGISNDRV